MNPIAPTWEVEVRYKVADAKPIVPKPPPGDGWQLWDVLVDPGFEGPDMTYEGGLYFIWVRPASCKEEGTGLGVCWEDDTADPDWREQLPSKQEMAAVIEEQGEIDEPTLEVAANVLRQLGYDDLADVVKDESEES